jgi:hypothetical protein
LLKVRKQRCVPHNELRRVDVIYFMCFLPIGTCLLTRFISKNKHGMTNALPCGAVLSPVTATHRYCVSQVDRLMLSITTCDSLAGRARAAGLIVGGMHHVLVPRLVVSEKESHLVDNWATHS